MKAALACMALLCVSATPPKPTLDTAATRILPSPFTASFITVPRIDCQTVRGSGVRLSDDIVITAAHVSNRPETCAAFGVPMKQVRIEPKRDVAFLQGDMGDGFRALYSCDGIKEGQRYLAMGYPFGAAPDSEPMIGTSTRDKDTGQVLLKGRNYHGMSGGGLFTEQGVLVAIINALAEQVNFTWVTPLSETYLCR